MYSLYRTTEMPMAFHLQECGADGAMSAYQQPNNSANIMMKNMLDLCIGVLAFYFFGYYIAYWDTHQIQGLADAGVDLAHWFCCFSYATTAATINSGALAGASRDRICAYLCWGNGWLQQLGFVDFAGSVVVHQVGAVSALVSTCILGPRIGRFKNYRAWKGLWKAPGHGVGAGSCHGTCGKSPGSCVVVV
eukprot:Skav234059  [mRNA]  locus=scaffold619:207971:214332:- [translate_table: standard]